MLALAVTFAP